MFSASIWFPATLEMLYPTPNCFPRRWKCRIQDQTIFRDAGNVVSSTKLFSKVKDTLYPASKYFQRLKKRRIQHQNILREGFVLRFSFERPSNGVHVGCFLPDGEHKEGGSPLLWTAPRSLVNDNYVCVMLAGEVIYYALREFLPEWHHGRNQIIQLSYQALAACKSASVASLTQRT